MGRSAKCRICGAKLDTDNAYKVVIKGKNFYFCSEKEYVEDKTKKDKVETDKNKTYKLVCSIIGRREIVNTALWKEWKEWNRVATDEVIWQYLEENKTYLTGMVSRLDDVEFNRIRYLSAILKNKLGDFKPKVKEVEKNVLASRDEHYETKFKLKKRIGLLDFEEDCYE